MSNVSERLQGLLADWSVYYQKLRNYHWNVKGPLFFELHVKFEELYTDAALKVDEIAERILTLGERPVSTMAGFLETASLKEDAGTPSAEEMVKNLVADTQALIQSQREIGRLADEANDVGTLNLLDGIADEQEKTLWMLRAYGG